MPKPKPERVRLRIGNVAKAVLITGQAYQDPKDALNEFVSNAAPRPGSEASGSASSCDERAGARTSPSRTSALAWRPSASETWRATCSTP